MDKEYKEEKEERRLKMKDDKGRYITQGLFLEIGYDTSKAIYTLDGEDKEYKGKSYPSLKKLFLTFSDPVEYNFANEYLYDWEHWQRISNNKILLEHISKWREELKLSLVSEGVLTLIDLAKNQQSYQAGKWLADNGWDKNTKGRPSREDVEAEVKKQADKMADYEEDFELLDISKRK